MPRLNENRLPIRSSKRYVLIDQFSSICVSYSISCLDFCARCRESCWWFPAMLCVLRTRTDNLLKLSLNFGRLVIQLPESNIHWIHLIWFIQIKYCLANRCQKKEPLPSLERNIRVFKYIHPISKLNQTLLSPLVFSYKFSWRMVKVVAGEICHGCQRRKQALRFEITKWELSLK